MRGQVVARCACRIPRVASAGRRRGSRIDVEPRSLPSRRRDRVAYALAPPCAPRSKAEAQLLAVHRGQPAARSSEAHATPGAARVAPARQAAVEREPLRPHRRPLVARAALARRVGQARASAASSIRRRIALAARLIVVAGHEQAVHASVRIAGTPPALVETTAQPLAKASSTDEGMLSMSGVCR